MGLEQVQGAVVLALGQERVVVEREEALWADCRRFLVGSSLVSLLECQPVLQIDQYNCLVGCTRRQQSYHLGIF